MTRKQWLVGVKAEAACGSSAIVPACSECRGIGSIALFTSIASCKACGGTGQQRIQRPSFAEFASESLGKAYGMPRHYYFIVTRDAAGNRQVHRVADQPVFPTGTKVHVTYGLYQNGDSFSEYEVLD